MGLRLSSARRFPAHKCAIQVLSWPASACRVRRLLPEDDRNACATAVAGFQLLEFSVIRLRLHYSKMAFRRPLLCASAASFQEVLLCISDATSVAVAITRCSMNTRLLGVFACTLHVAFRSCKHSWKEVVLATMPLRSVIQDPLYRSRPQKP